jgi:hypothetical protein
MRFRQLADNGTSRPAICAGGVLAQSYGIAPDPRWIEGAIEAAISAVSQLRASSSEVVTPSSQASRRLASGCCARDEVPARISHCVRWGPGDRPATIDET